MVFNTTPGSMSMVDITDKYVIIADVWNADNGIWSGACYLFDNSNNNDSWINSQILNGSDTTAGDYFGSSVSISYKYDDKYIIIGAMGR